MIPVRNISIDMGVYNTHIGLIIFHIAFQTGFCTFFLRNFIKELPFELIEAARADGATEWTIYRKIILPLIVPALAALGVLEFTFIWNDYFGLFSSYTRRYSKTNYSWFRCFAWAVDY